MRVLIVDDDMVVSRALSRVLRSLGHETRCACSVDDALHALVERPDLLLVDYDLGDSCSGVDLATWAIAAYQVSVVLITGHAVDWVRAELIHAGLSDVEVLPKPFSIVSVGAAVARHAAPPEADPWDVFEVGGRRHVT